MNIDDHLIKLKKQIDIELENYFELKIAQIKNENKPEEMAEIIESLRDFTLNSGKRIRPILFYFGYVLAGGKNIIEALKASVAIELAHSYLLIHDDIIDRDNFRHGGLSMHYKYEKLFAKKLKAKKIRHFGVSMAILAGDSASALACEILAGSDFSSNLKIKAISKLNCIIENTIAGEAIDVILVEYPNVKIDKIFEMQKYKTAKYTIEGPLHLGAILAGAEEKFLESLSEFAIPAGIAFQIQDDIIGIFGDEKKIGKPVGSDIREGKKTLLIAKAMENGDKAQKNLLNSSLGNENISNEDINKTREIIIKTGSLEFSRNKARELANEAKKRLNDLNISEENKKFLNDLANFIVGREY
jgi:geranylgeranyl diphosphate synthase, type I